MLNKIKSVVLLVVALGVMYSPAAQAGEWLVVRAAEACSGMRAGDQSPTPAFDNNAVLQSDPDDAQRFWCRIEVPNDKYISDANVYGTDTTGSAYVNIDLRRSAYNSRTSSSVSTWISTTNETTWDAPAALCHQVSKTSYSYWLYVWIPAVSDNDLEVWGFDLYMQDSAC